MKHSYLYDVDGIYLVTTLLTCMIIAVFAGYKFGSKQTGKDPDHSMLLSSLLALLGLLLAFTFSMAGSRYDMRKQNIVEESNCIGTAILRTDLFPDSIRDDLRKDLRNYVSSRIMYFESGRNDEKLKDALLSTNKISTELWAKTSLASKNKDYFLASQLMVPAINSMFDIGSTVNASYNATVPDSIVWLILIFSVLTAFFIGYNCGIKKVSDKLLLTGFCILTCVVIYIILDLDRPRRGIINLNHEVQILESLMPLFK